MRGFFKITLFALLLSLSLRCSKEKSAETTQDSTATGSVTNTAPSISTMLNQTINVNESTSSIIFVINDSENTLDCQSSLSLVSDNTDLVSSSDVTFSGTPPTCSAVLTPKTNQFGKANVTFIVSDGTLTDAETFLLKVNFTPSIFSNLEVWLDSKDETTIFNDENCSINAANGDNILCWKDKSENVRNATQASGQTKGPLFDSTLPTIFFDGVNDYFNIDLDFMANQTHHAFIIAYTQNISNYYGAALGNSGANSLHAGLATSTSYRLNYWGNDFLPTISTKYIANSYNILNFSWSPGFFKQVYANGNLEGYSTTNIGTITGMAGGGAIGYVAGISYFQGYIREMIFISGDLSAANRELIEGYLACKWNLQSQLNSNHPYISDCP